VLSHGHERRDTPGIYEVQDPPRPERPVSWQAPFAVLAHLWPAHELTSARVCFKVGYGFGQSQ
jgi:hypothetical protein